MNNRLTPIYKVFSAEKFDTITGGKIAANTQYLSLTKDIAGAIGLNPDDSVYQELIDMKGSIFRNEDGSIGYKSHAGRIVQHGEAVIPYASYGGVNSNWVSKMDQGLFGYSVRNNKGVRLSDGQIETLLNRYKDEWAGVNFESNVEVYNMLEGIFQKEGLKAGYSIEDINKITLPKILINDSEKSMNHLGYMRIGSIDSNVRSVLEQYGDKTKALIEKAVPTEQALRAFFSNEEKMYKVFSANGFDSWGSFMKAVREESYAADRLLFGKGGVFEGYFAIGNDAIAKHKNKGSIAIGVLEETIAMLGKYSDVNDINDLIENKTSRQRGLQKLIDLVNNTQDDQGNYIYRFFKGTDNIGYELKLNGESLMLKSSGKLKEGLTDFDVMDASRLENLVNKVNDIIKAKQAELGMDVNSIEAMQDQLIHTADDYEDGPYKLIGRMGYIKDKDGKLIITHSSGIGSNKLTIESETQSGMTYEYVQAKKQLMELQADREQLGQEIRAAEKAGAVVDDAYYEKYGVWGNQIEMLKAQVNDLKETGHLFEFSDRERNILNQRTLSEDYYTNLQKRILNKDDILTEKAINTNRALRGLDRSRYSENHRVFGFLEEELMGQMYYNRYEEELLTPKLLKSKEYQHLQGIYDSYVTKQGKRLGTENAQKIYDLQMVELANKFNNGNRSRITLKDMTDAGFEILTPQQYAERFGDVGVPGYENVVKNNIILDLGKEFDTALNDTNAYQRYVAVPGAGDIVGDADIKKDWHVAAGGLVRAYQEDYMGLRGEDPNYEDRRKQVMDRIARKTEELNDSTAGYIKKKGILHQRAKQHIYTAMDRTKIMSIPAEKSDLLNRAMAHGKSLAQWREEGVYYDAFFDSYESFKKRGFFSDETLKAYGMSSEQEMIDYLQTHGTVMIDDRYPNIRQTSLTSARHYLYMGDELHATNASYGMQETLLKILGDSDGDSVSKFMITNQGVSHGQYERFRILAEEQADQMSFGSIDERNAWVKTETMKNANITEKIYDDFSAVDAEAVMQATTVNTVYHEDVVSGYFDDWWKTREAQSLTGRKGSLIAELQGGTSILGREKLTALATDPTFEQVKDSLSSVNHILEDVKKNAEYLNGDYDLILKGSSNILDYQGDETTVLDKALTAMQYLRDNNLGGITDDVLSTAEMAAKQRVRINSYYSEILSKLGIGAVGNVNSAFYATTQTIKNFYSLPGSTKDQRIKNEIYTALGYEFEQSSISSKKIVLKSGDTRLINLTDNLNNIRKYGYDKLSDVGQEAMAYMKQYGDADKAIKQYNLISKTIDLGVENTFDLKTQRDEILEFMYGNMLQAHSDVWRDEQMSKMARAYSSIATGKANPEAVTLAAGMLANSLLGQAINDTAGTVGDVVPKSTTKSAEQILLANSAIGKDATDLVAKGVNKIKNLATSSVSGTSTGAALAMGVVGLAGGLIAAGYASGNPLNDANPETVAKEQTRPRMSFGPDMPQMAPNNTGGYIINIKGDTSKGNRQLKRAMKMAANNSVGGAVNINMSLKTSREGGYTDKDIENILSNYF